MDRESLYPGDWLKKAEKDFKRVEKRIEEGDLSDGAFHLQQALEKYLKAYLLSKGWKLKKIHDLRVLLEEAAIFTSELSEFNSLCSEVTAYYMLDRYPFFQETIDKEDLEIAVDKANKLITIIVEMMEK